MTTSGTARDCVTACAVSGSKLVCTADGSCACTLPRMNWGCVAAWCGAVVLLTCAPTLGCRARAAKPETPTQSKRIWARLTHGHVRMGKLTAPDATVVIGTAEATCTAF
jgi:hypothetical protein